MGEQSSRCEEASKLSLPPASHTGVTAANRRKASFSRTTGASSSCLSVTRTFFSVFPFPQPVLSVLRSCGARSSTKRAALRGVKAKKAALPLSRLATPPPKRSRTTQQCELARLAPTKKVALTLLARPEEAARLEGE